MLRLRCMVSSYQQVVLPTKDEYVSKIYLCATMQRHKVEGEIGVTGHSSQRRRLDHVRRLNVLPLYAIVSVGVILAADFYS